QGGRLWVAALLILTMMLLAPFRACFYRHAHLLSGPLQPSSAMSLVVLVICLFALALTRPHTHVLANNAWWAIILSEEVPNSLRVAVAVTVVLGLRQFGCWCARGACVSFPWTQTAGSSCGNAVSRR